MKNNSKCEYSYVVYWIHREVHTSPDNEGYIGITKNVEKRIKDHFNRPSNLHLKYAMNKYSDIKHTILYEYINEYDAIEIEKRFRPNKNIGWNIAEGGGIPPSNLGVKFTEERKEKHRGNNNGFYGKKHSDETKEFMSKRMKESSPLIGTKREDHSKVMSNKIHVNNGTESRMVSKETAEQFLKDNPDWKYGRKKFKPKPAGSVVFCAGTIFINKDGIAKRIKPEELQNFLDAGWVKGRGVAKRNL